jgi:hypothetical protein
MDLGARLWTLILFAALLVRLNVVRLVWVDRRLGRAEWWWCPRVTLACLHTPAHTPTPRLPHLALRLPLYTFPYHLPSPPHLPSLLQAGDWSMVKAMKTWRGRVCQYYANLFSRLAIVSSVAVTTKRRRPEGGAWRRRLSWHEDGSGEMTKWRRYSVCGTYI